MLFSFSTLQTTFKERITAILYKLKSPKIEQTKNKEYFWKFHIVNTVKVSTPNTMIIAMFIIL